MYAKTQADAFQQFSNFGESCFCKNLVMGWQDMVIWALGDLSCIKSSMVQKCSTTLGLGVRW